MLDMFLIPLHGRIFEKLDHNPQLTLHLMIIIHSNISFSPTLYLALSRCWGYRERNLQSLLHGAYTVAGRTSISKNNKIRLAIMGQYNML